MADRNSEHYARSVAEIQTYLRRLSYEYPEIYFIATDGIFGNETKKAVTDFQRIFDLPQTGVVNKQTWDKITRESERLEKKKTAAIRVNMFEDIDRIYNIGDRGDAVFAIQIMQNYLFGRLAGIKRQSVSGIYNNITESNTRIVQRAAKLPETGKLGKESWNAHVRSYENI